MVVAGELPAQKSAATETETDTETEFPWGIKNTAGLLATKADNVCVSLP